MFRVEPSLFSPHSLESMTQLVLVSCSPPDRGFRFLSAFVSPRLRDTILSIRAERHHCKYSGEGSVDASCALFLDKTRGQQTVVEQLATIGSDDTVGATIGSLEADLGLSC